MEQILNHFQRDLERDATTFLQEAKRVAEYDAVLRDGQRDLLRLGTVTQQILVRQSDLAQRLGALQDHQSDMDRQLNHVEAALDQLFASQAQWTPQEADVQRERAYTTAIAIDERLSQLQNGLHDALRTLDDGVAGGAAGLAGPSGDQSQLLRILNQHQNALVEFELTSHRLEQDLKLVKSALSRSIPN